MRNSLIPRLFGQFGRRGLALSLAMAVAALAACGGASAGSTPDAPPTQDTMAPAGTDGAASAADGRAPAASAAPNFRLSNAAGETVTLDSYAGLKNVVLVFYRGFW